jgi:guanylate kinase
MKGNLIIISSPSGGGKGTLIKEILKSVSRIGYSVSFTTRAARAGEENARHYFFVGEERFKELIDEGEFLEYAEVHGHFYGTSIKQVQGEIELGRDIILEIDVQGAESVRKKIPEAVSIFILPPSFEVLRQRLIARGTDTPQELEVRLRNAPNELRQYSSFDYVIINDQVERAARQLAAIIHAERARCERQEKLVRQVIEKFWSSEE